ncbi:helix-turn-helix and ligand-binding sensor domain-containing protein [Gracilimonas mengyeensis]|uniref:Y_Y_Y domain-containing protein n=1 Tax=Gracilimonas mengyeensis TaxID=1302730 RepID=A0A521BVM5_9BACT|nr:triple tyrosine motif-containing protein [Gracilimonas mengyeensis]SMO51228.1 Y_Y_Y domain-containing protein [Gracilimonas mengyeensis]
MRRFLAFLLVALVADFSTGIAQVSYQVSNYRVNESRAGNQNWDIASDGSQQIFVANNYGLLVLENSNFSLHELPGRTIFRSVAYINEKIFTGSFEDFGFWEEDESGELRYHSLATRLENPDLNNDEIWKIIEHQGKVYFHSFGTVYGYDPETEDVYRLPTPGSMMFLNPAGGKVYTQAIQGPMYRLQDDAFIPVEGSNFLQDEEVKSVISLPDSLLLIGTSKGLYRYDGDTFTSWQAENKEEVVRNNINTMIRTEDKIIIGTILNGLYIYDLNFQLLKNLNTQNRLQNNTILSLEVDPFQNLWVGMDKGLDYIAFDTPVHSYREELEDIGSVYAAALFNSELYIGTNQGIYWFKQDENGNFYDKELVPGSQGQVWFIKEFDGKLYSGLNDGTYVIENKQLQKIGMVHGGYNLKAYPKENQDLLLQSTYSDLVAYQKNESGIWEQAYPLSGFQSPARFLEFDHMGNIWLGHTVKGLFRLQPNIQLNKIDQVTEMGSNYGLPQSTNKLFKLDTRIMTSIGDTLYQWNAIDEQFVPYTGLDEYFTEKGSVANISPAGQEQYWVIKGEEINLFEIYFNSIQLRYRLLPQMYDFKLIEGYEKIIPLNQNLHLICLDDGFAILNMDMVERSKYPVPSVDIQPAVATSSQGEITMVKAPDTELSYRDNTVEFNWSTSQVAGNRAFFQYKLEGLETEWNSWTTDTQTRYLRLPPGGYTFSVRSIGPNGLVTETASFPFSINPPWYSSTQMFILYVVLFISLVLMGRFYISRKRWKELGKDLEEKHRKMVRDREKAEKKIIKLNNEKLQEKIEHRSAQLASNTMAMMRKNNLLNTIQQELEKQKEDLGDQLPDKYYKKLNKLIEDGIEDEHEWEIFEQLYNEAHGDFFKRLKETYPQLTPSDLRLCAYLRMNLSSKEIAPLLNISVRGVEERRYRLRKRLDLSTDTNLTELIMTF